MLEAALIITAMIAILTVIIAAWNIIHAIAEEARKSKTEQKK